MKLFGHFTMLLARHGLLSHGEEEEEEEIEEDEEEKEQNDPGVHFLPCLKLLKKE